MTKEIKITVDRYEFKFNLYKNKMQISYLNNLWDTHDYGFVDLDKISVKKITSYSSYAAQKTMNALKEAKVSTQKLKKVANELMA